MLEEEEWMRDEGDDDSSIVREGVFGEPYFSQLQFPCESGVRYPQPATRSIARK